MFISHIGILILVLSQCEGLVLLPLSGQGNTITVSRQEKENQKFYNADTIPRRRYLLSKNKLMWKDASIACKKKGLALAYEVDFFDYLEMQTFLLKVKKYTSESPLEFWVGGYRESTDSTRFRWENGKHVNYYGWIGSKSNVDNRNCLEMKYDSKSFALNNVNCDKFNKYICVGDLNEELRKIDFVEPDERPAMHEEANRNIKEGTWFVTPKTSTTTTTEDSEFHQPVEFWVGGTRKSLDSTHFLWETGEYVQFFGWLTKESSVGSNADCLEVKYDSNRFGWNEVNCDKFNKYICVGEPHEELLKTDFVEPNKRPEKQEEVEQKVNEATTLVTTEISSTSSTPTPKTPHFDSDEEFVLYTGEEHHDMDDNMYNYDYNGYI